MRRRSASSRGSTPDSVVDMAARRCQRRIVAGETNRRSRNPVGSTRTNAAITARLAQSRRGFGLPLRSTATSWRSTSNSTSFNADERPEQHQQPHQPEEDPIQQTQHHDSRARLAHHVSVSTSRALEPTSGTPHPKSEHSGWVRRCVPGGVPFGGVSRTGRPSCVRWVRFPGAPGRSRVHRLPRGRGISPGCWSSVAPRRSRGR